MAPLPDPESQEWEAYALVWMRCPYHADICDAEAVFEPQEDNTEFALAGLLTCANGHKWSLVKLEDEGGDS